MPARGRPILGEPIPLPVLEESLCTRCGDCVNLCPTRCLEATPTGPWLPRPLDCIGCSACVLLCPSQALRLAG